MARVARTAAKLDLSGRLAPKKGSSFGAVTDILNPGGRLSSNLGSGQPITARNLLDPDNAVLHAPPGAPPPPPTFPDVTGAALNAKRAVRRRAVTSGLGSTVLTGGYSPTGQASTVLGGG